MLLSQILKQVEFTADLQATLMDLSLPAVFEIHRNCLEPSMHILDVGIELIQIISDGVSVFHIAWIFRGSNHFTYSWTTRRLSTTFKRDLINICIASLEEIALKNTWQQQLC